MILLVNTYRDEVRFYGKTENSIHLCPVHKVVTRQTWLCVVARKKMPYEFSGLSEERTLSPPIFTNTPEYISFSQCVYSTIASGNTRLLLHYRTL